MSWTRRDLLRAAGAAAALGALPTLPACGTDPGPDYAYDGPPADRDRFVHGVASGDPLTDSVVLWTHIDLGELESLDVYVEVHRTEALDDRIAARMLTAEAVRGGCVKVDLDGLRAGETVFYRFRCQDQTSPVGRTRTAPKGRTQALKMGVVSCSNYARGWFHVYAFLAEQDLDLIAHLGDYLYEYAVSTGQARRHQPANELITLDDYRTRYAQYRTDADLAEAHRQHPWVLTWDDHETANNAYVDGADNHQTGEGPWADRVASARQAWFEWMPVREGEAGRLYRQLPWGDLADLIVLDTRIEGRLAQTRDLDTVLQEDRQLLGAEQEAWAIGSLDDSRARWRIILQQVVMAPWVGVGDAPLNPDAWDGYPAARERLLQAMGDAGDVIVLTGDVHSSFASELPLDRDDPSSSVGVEAVTPGVTSSGAEVGDLIDVLLSANPHIQFAETTRQGCVILDVGRDEATATWWHLPEDAVLSETPSTPEAVRAFAVDRGQPRWRAVE